MEETNEIKDKETKPVSRHILGVVTKVLLWIAGLWAALLVILQIALSSSLLTEIVSKYAKEYIDGEVSFGNISVSMFKHFPNIGVTLEDFAITYPSNRYATAEQTGVQGELLWSGTGETADTLARFSKFTVGLNIPSLISGNINIPELHLDQPRFFIHNYADGQSNLQILKLENGEEQAQEDESSTLPNIKLGTINLTSHPHVVFTDSRDSIFTVIDFKKMAFDGKIDLNNLKNSKLGLTLDSMFIAGRIASDTLAVGIDKINIDEHDNHIDLSAAAKTFVGTKALGRLSIPVEFKAGIAFPQDTVPAIHIEHFGLSVASIPLQGNLDLRFHENKTAIKSKIGINNCKLDSMLKDLVSYFIPEADKISTDAILSVDGECDGFYIHSIGKLPEFNIKATIPDAEIRHTDFPSSLRFKINCEASADKKGRINASIDSINIQTTGLKIAGNGKLYDVLSKDPGFNVNGNLSAVLDSIVSVFIPDSLGVYAHGKLDAGINGTANISHLDIYNFGKANITGHANGKNIIIDYPKEDLKVSMGKIDLKLGPEIKKFGKAEVKLLAATGEIDSLHANYQDAFDINGKNIVLIAKNNRTQKQKDSDVSPLGFRVKAEMLKVKDAESMTLTLDETDNGFLVYPKKGHKDIPILNLSSKNKRIFLRNATNRLILTDAAIKTEAAMNTIERKEKAKRLIDSLSNIYPDIPKDSLFAHTVAINRSKPLPSWMSEDDFKKQDLDLRLDQTIAKYFREWDLDGNIHVRTGILITPYFPMRNILRGLEVNFTNNRIDIDTLALLSGQSKIAAKGSLTGIKRALLGGKSPLTLNLDLTSDKVNTDELLKAYAYGSKYKPSESKNIDEVSDSEFLKMVTIDTCQVSETTSLVVIPSNIIANITVNAQNISYSDLAIKSLTSKMTMKERCVQITDTKAISNAGNISFDGFYSTRSKKDLKAGFNFNFSDITAEKVVSLMPVVDTIMPMLKSFKGMLDCDLAATSDLDTNMNIVMPSINGVLRIGGKGLTINDSDIFRDIARKLKFDNYDTGYIDNMTVEGVIKDNVLEVFPFVLKLDRYTLAMSGIQNLDMSFKYHVSVVKSPMIFKLGVDIYGNDFDHLKFRIGKPKYKTADVPVFSSVVNDTKINLLRSIRGIFEKGVEAAIIENEKLQAIEKMKKDIGYVNVAEQIMAPLTEQEKNMYNNDSPITTTILTTTGIAVKTTDTNKTTK